MINLPQRPNSNPSDSAVQRGIELKMLQRLVEKHPDWQRVTWKTLASELSLSPIWQKAKPDAVWKNHCNRIIIAECYSRVGELKAGHLRKLAMDAIKLLALRDALKGYSVDCLLVVPEELKSKLTSDGWFPAALHLVAEIVSVDLQEDERKELVAASTRQAQGQARTKRDGKDRVK